MLRRFATGCKLLLIFAVSCVALSSASQARAADADETGFRPIFNGKTLGGWAADPRIWSVKDDSIVADSGKEAAAPAQQFCFWQRGTLDDFDLRLSFRLTANNDRPSVQLPVALFVDPQHGVVNPRASEAAAPITGKPIAMTPTGDSAELKKLFHNGEWNELEVRRAGSQLAMKLNGQEVASAGNSTSATAAGECLLALEPPAVTGGRLEFKEIRLKRLRLKDRKKVVMVAGTPSHGPAEHEFNAGSLLLKKCLDESAPQVQAVVYMNGWPGDPTAFDNADAIMLYMDGGGQHPVVGYNRLAEIDYLMKQGVGLICAHYAVEVNKDKGGPEFLRWIGGYFEPYWSVNPTWMMTKATLAKDHPITRGVKPFDIQDEWYYHMRFPENMEGVTPILSAIPPDSTHDGKDDAHGGNKYVRARKGQIEVMSWAFERPSGGRGYGFTGGHYHKNWGNDDYRKLMLNAILWVAKADVPADGVNSKVSEEELKANLDKKR